MTSEQGAVTSEQGARRVTRTASLTSRRRHKRTVIMTIGMMITHFENLSPEFQKRGIAQGKHVVTERMTRDAVKQADDRAQAVHDKELAEIQKLKTDKDREVWIRSKLSKAETDVPDFLKPKKKSSAKSVLPIQDTFFFSQQI